jgi:hypothetical protein
MKKKKRKLRPVLEPAVLPSIDRQIAITNAVNAVKHKMVESGELTLPVRPDYEEIIESDEIEELKAEIKEIDALIAHNNHELLRWTIRRDLIEERLRDDLDK